jgi:hypothetical protein
MPITNRELAARDCAARLPRAVDEAEPAAPGPAALRVDERLQPAQRRDLLPNRGRLAARVRPHRLDAADRLVLDRLRDDQPLAGQPCALQPDVVRLLVGHGVVRRPAGERGPAVGVVGPEGQTVAQ